MKAYIFFSVHEELFHRIAEGLAPYGVTSFGGFVWGRNQVRSIENRGVEYDPLLVFTRDMLPQIEEGPPPDLAWLERRETELGVSIQRMLASERHLLAGRSFDEIMRMAEVALREVAAIYDRVKPDFVFSEDVSCFHSYVHFVLARERGIPFWCIGHGRLPYRLAVYSSGLQHLERVERLYPTLRERGLSAAEREEAEAYVAKFRKRPERPTGMDVRAKRPGIELADAGRGWLAAKRYLDDPRDPTATAPLGIVRNRLRRIARNTAAELSGVFEKPVAGEKYVLYPIHYQPEASTLVQAPMYVDQLALLQDMVKVLPAGYRLYVKEHLTNKGRRPLEFYRAIKALPAVRLLGPEEDTWSLIQNASVIAVITGTMGWEGMLFDKPVVTFGDVFFNMLPNVYRAGQTPKDGWYALFKRATTNHVIDRESLLALISALHQCSSPGFMAQATSFPGVLDEENIANITSALVREAGLAHRSVAAG